LRVPVSVTRQHGNHCEAVSQDISLDGLSILGDIEFFRGERLRIVLDLPPHDPCGWVRLDLVCRVRYVVEIMYPARTLRVGLRHENLTGHSQGRITEYMAHALPPNRYRQSANPSAQAR